MATLHAIISEAATEGRRELTLDPVVTEAWAMEEGSGELPAGLYRLFSLNALLVTGAPSLITMSPEIGALVGLQTLDLRSNGLIALPAAIGALGSLRTLIVSGNRLTTLPPEIGACGCVSPAFCVFWAAPRNELHGNPSLFNCCDSSSPLLRHYCNRGLKQHSFAHLPSVMLPVGDVLSCR